MTPAWAGMSGIGGGGNRGGHVGGSDSEHRGQGGSIETQQPRPVIAAAARAAAAYRPAAGADPRLDRADDVHHGDDGSDGRTLRQAAGLGPEALSDRHGADLLSDARAHDAAPDDNADTQADRRHPRPGRGHRHSPAVVATAVSAASAAIPIIPSAATGRLAQSLESARRLGDRRRHPARASRLWDDLWRDGAASYRRQAPQFAAVGAAAGIESRRPVRSLGPEPVTGALVASLGVTRMSRPSGRLHLAKLGVVDAWWHRHWPAADPAGANAQPACPGEAARRRHRARHGGPRASGGQPRPNAIPSRNRSRPHPAAAARRSRRSRGFGARSIIPSLATAADQCRGDGSRAPASRRRKTAATGNKDRTGRRPRSCDRRQPDQSASLREGDRRARPDCGASSRPSSIGSGRSPRRCSRAG